MGWRKPVPETPVLERSDPTFSVGDSTALSEFLGMTGSTAAGVSVTQSAALGLSAFYRAVCLISGTIAGLPLRSLKRVGDSKERVASWLDDPDPGGLTQFEWVEGLVLALLLNGNWFALIVRGGAGQVLGLKPIPATAVRVEADQKHGRLYKVTTATGEIREFTSVDLVHVMGPSLDGIRGMSVVQVARQSLGTAIAGDQAAGKMFASGMLLGGILTSKESLSPEQAAQVVAGFKARATGTRNAGDIAFLPADLTYTAWGQTADDAEFLGQRRYGIEEVSRWTGVPVELLSQNAASSWGSGIAELVRAFQKFALAGWTSRIESRLSGLMPEGTFAEFDFAGLLQPSPEVEIALLIQQVEAGLLTVAEARGLRNLPPLPSAVPDAAGGPTLEAVA